MVLAKYCTMDSLTPESYWKTLLRIAHYCGTETFVNKQYSWIKAYSPHTPLAMVKEYQRLQVVAEVKEGDAVYYTFSEKLVKKLPFSETVLSRKMEDVNVSIREETLLMFKDCTVRALSGNTFEVVDGEPNEFLASSAFSISYRGNNTYEFARKSNTLSTRSIRSRIRKTVMKCRRDNNFKNQIALKEDNKEEVSEVSEVPDVSLFLNVKALLSKQSSLQRKGGNKKARRSSESEFRANSFVQRKAKDISSIKIEGYFVNKLYE